MTQQMDDLLASSQTLHRGAVQRLWPDVWEHPEALARHPAVGGGVGWGGGEIGSDTSQSSALCPLRHRGAVTDTNDLSCLQDVLCTSHRITAY